MQLSDRLLDQYDYFNDPLLEQHLHTQDRLSYKAMYHYGAGQNHFGHQLTAHQTRVAREGAALLRFIGYSGKTAANYRAAMEFHDIGKINEIYNPFIWSQEDRPSKEDKILQKKHAPLGAQMWDEWCTQHAPQLKDHPHYHIRKAVTSLHHERFDGKGPLSLNAAQMPIFVQISCIVDAYDGDRIKRPHQPKRRSPREALRRMAALDDPQYKYKDAFNEDLLQKYIKMKEQQLDIQVL